MLAKAGTKLRLLTLGPFLALPVKISKSLYEETTQSRHLERGANQDYKHARNMKLGGEIYRLFNETTRKI